MEANFDKNNSIKCIYEIEKEDLNKEINLINKGYYSVSYVKFIETNKDITSKVNFIINGEKKTDILTYKFNKEGIYTIYIIGKKDFTNMSGMFHDCESLISIDFSNCKTNNVTDMSGLFSNCKSLKYIDFSNFNTINVVNMSHMFINCKSLTSVDLSIFNTVNAIDLSYMFSGCVSLKSIELTFQF